MIYNEALVADIAPANAEDVQARTGRNVPMLLAVLAHILEHQETWDQANWYSYPGLETAELTVESEASECKTSYCFAGWTAVLDGVPPPPLKMKGDWGITPDKETVGMTYQGLGGGRASGIPGGTVDVADYARTVLGLSRSEANHLFDGNNTLLQVTDYVRQLVNGEELEPTYCWNFPDYVSEDDDSDPDYYEE